MIRASPDHPALFWCLNDYRGCHTLVALFATEPALSEAEGVGSLTFLKPEAWRLAPDWVPHFSPILREVGKWTRP